MKFKKQLKLFKDANIYFISIEPVEVIKKFAQFDIKEAAEELISEMDKLTLSIELKVTISNVLINYKSKEVQDFLINYVIQYYYLI